VNFGSRPVALHFGEGREELHDEISACDLRGKGKVQEARKGTHSANTTFVIVLDNPYGLHEFGGISYSTRDWSLLDLLERIRISGQIRLIREHPIEKESMEETRDIGHTLRSSGFRVARSSTSSNCCMINSWEQHTTNMENVRTGMPRCSAAISKRNLRISMAVQTCSKWVFHKHGWITTRRITR